MRLYFDDCHFCVHEYNQIKYIQVGFFFFSISVCESRANNLWLCFLIGMVIECHASLNWSNSNFFHFLMSFLDKRCLILLLDTEKPTILDTTNTSFTLSLPSATPQQLCPGISQPTPTYLVLLGQMTNSHGNSSYRLSALQQNSLVWYFGVKMHMISYVNRECDITASHFTSHFITFSQGVFPFLYRS